MSFRLPQTLGDGRRKGEGGLNPIEAAVAAEKAASLGLAGRRLELALEKLRAEPSEARIDEAAELAWGFLIQRELCGLSDRERVIAEFAIPPQVVARIGVIRRPA